MTTFTREQADKAAEKMIADYAAELNLSTPDDVSKALEYLISKAARGIEKHCGIATSCEVVFRTLHHLQETLKATLKPYLFFREEGFYAVGYPSDEEAIKGAISNIGTLRVETPDGGLVWKRETH